MDHPPEPRGEEAETNPGILHSAPPKAASRVQFLQQDTEPLLLPAFVLCCKMLTEDSVNFLFILGLVFFFYILWYIKTSKICELDKLYMLKSSCS